MTAAWLVLCAGFIAHVYDEATSGFLEWLNADATGLRERIPWFPIEYWPWLIALSIAIAVLIALTPLVWRGARGTRTLARVYGVVHVVNAIAHMTISVVAGRIMPGTWSSPALLLAALWLLWETERAYAEPARPR